MRHVHPIEKESYRILREMVDLSHLGPLGRAVAERVVHASADPEYATSLVLDEPTLRDGLDALSRDAPIVTDVHMVAAGITARETLCLVSDPRALDLSEELGTRCGASRRVRRGCGVQGCTFAERSAGCCEPGAEGWLRGRGGGVERANLL